MVGCLFVLSSGGDAGLGVGLLSAGLCRLLALFSLVTRQYNTIHINTINIIQSVYDYGCNNIC